MPRPTLPAIRRRAAVAATTLAATTLLTGEAVGQSLPSPPPVDPPKVTEPKVEAPKAPTPRVEKPDPPASPRVEPGAPAPKVEAPTPPAPKAPAPKVETPRTPAPKPDTPRAPAPRAETPKGPSPRVETPKAPSPKVETPKVPAPRVEAPKEPVSPKAPATPRSPVDPRSRVPGAPRGADAPARVRTPARPDRPEDGAPQRVRAPRAPGVQPDGDAPLPVGESADPAAAPGGSVAGGATTGTGTSAGAAAAGAAAATGGALLEVLGVSASGGGDTGADRLRTRIERSDRFRRTSSQRRLARVLERNGGCLSRLTSIRRRVVLLRVGVDGRRPLSRRQVAERVGIPVGRLVREERAASRALRSAGACSTSAVDAGEAGAVVLPGAIAGMDADSAARGIGALLAGDPGAAGRTAATGEVAGARLSGTRDAEADAGAPRGEVVETPFGALDPTSGIGLALGSLLVVLAVLTVLLIARDVRRQWRV